MFLSGLEELSTIYMILVGHKDYANLQNLILQKTQIDNALKRR